MISGFCICALIAKGRGHEYFLVHSPEIIDHYPLSDFLHSLQTSINSFLSNSFPLACGHPSIGFQIPQGGLEAGEDYYTALARELREETCLWDYQIISELHPLLRYIWPTQLSTLPYLGQAQKYFLVRISDAASKQLGPSEEFDFFRWADIDFLLAKVVPFKRNIYQRAWELLNPPI